MAALSDYAEAALLKHIAGIAAYTQPSGYKLALSTADPGEDASGLAEPAGNGYARENIAWSSDGQVSDKEQVSNDALITFTASGGAWGTITHIAIYDTEGTPNMLAYGALDTSRTIADGESLQFAIGAVKWTLD